MSAAALKMLSLLLLTSIPLRAQTEPILRLGGERGVAGDLFSSVTDVALDPRDRVLIPDDADSRIVVVGIDGRLRQTLGRRGAGPVEFAAPTAIVGTAIGSGRFPCAPQVAHGVHHDDVVPEVRVYRTERSGAVCQ